MFFQEKGKKLKFQKERSGCVDVFHAFLVSKATFDGADEIPIIEPYEGSIPSNLVTFSKRKRASSGSWLCFYEDDVKFECLWNNPKRYLKELLTYDGLILPDFSVFRDMPLAQQVWNIYRSRALGTWLQEQGINVIPNIRWGDNRTYATACAGISKGSVIAVGSHGLMKDVDERKEFIKGLDYVVQYLEPKAILVYGSVPEEVFQYIRFLGTEIVHYPSELSLYYKGGVA